MHFFCGENINNQEINKKEKTKQKTKERRAKSKILFSNWMEKEAHFLEGFPGILCLYVYMYMYVWWLATDRLFRLGWWIRFSPFQAASCTTRLLYTIPKTAYRRLETESFYMHQIKSCGAKRGHFLIDRWARLILFLFVVNNNKKKKPKRKRRRIKSKEKKRGEFSLFLYMPRLFSEWTEGDVVVSFLRSQMTAE